MAIIRIDYDEKNPETYKGVEINYIIGKEDKTQLFNSGDFIKDWYECNKFIINSDIIDQGRISISSSVDHFIMDGAPFKSAYLHLVDGLPVLRYTYSYEEPGLEFFVKNNEILTWEQLKEYCGDKKD